MVIAEADRAENENAASHDSVVSAVLAA